MNTNIKKTLQTIALSFGALLTVSTAVYATGTLTPSGTAGDDTQYSLNDIYSKLTDFSDTPTATSSPFSIPGSVAASFNTLSEIYGLLEAEEADLVAGNIADGVTIFGVTGELISGLEWSTSLGTTTWYDATLDCSLLTEGGVPAGTWRLPTIHELGDAIAEDWGGGTGSRFAIYTVYWSGTETSSSDAMNAIWYGSLDATGSSAKTLPSNAVLCVR